MLLSFESFKNFLDPEPVKNGRGIRKFLLMVKFSAKHAHSIGHEDH
jgi:hypothetical protein